MLALVLCSQQTHQGLALVTHITVQPLLRWPGGLFPLVHFGHVNHQLQHLPQEPGIPDAPACSAHPACSGWLSQIRELTDHLMPVTSQPRLCIPVRCDPQVARIWRTPGTTEALLSRHPTKGVSLQVRCRMSTVSAWLPELIMLMLRPELLTQYWIYWLYSMLLNIECLWIHFVAYVHHRG